MSSILKVRHSTSGEWIDIPAIVGPKGGDGAPGKDAPQEAVLYIPQTLTPEQQAQARENIGAIAIGEIPTGGSKWVLEKTLTLEKDVNQVDFTFDTPCEAFAIVFIGRVNDADDTLADGTARIHIKDVRSGYTFSAGEHVYIRKNATLQTGWFIEKLPHDTLRTNVFYPMRHPYDPTEVKTYMAYFPTTWDTLCIFLLSSEQLFKAGGTFYIYRR